MTKTKSHSKKVRPGPQRDDGRGRLLLWNAFQIAYYLPNKREEALEVLDLARDRRQLRQARSLRGSVHALDGKAWSERQADVTAEALRRAAHEIAAELARHENCPTEHRALPNSRAG
jgi:hypothetical protein